jgi:hypothetical protein
LFQAVVEPRASRCPVIVVRHDAFPLLEPVSIPRSYRSIITGL